jgi:hypothetical protein
MKYKPNSLHIQSKGRYLSSDRISKRIHHVGLYTKNIVDDNPFYTGILGFKEIWRHPADRNINVMYLYLQIPDCVENIEHSGSTNINFNHPCFVVEDMQETIYTLKERRIDEKLNRPVIGKGNRWLLNLTNSDGTKVEFTEIHTVK